MWTRAPLASGTPRPAPNDRPRPGLLAPGSLPRLRLPGEFENSRQWRRGARLPGHSCGGSRGVEPHSLGALALATQFHCSERYVHRLFATTGRSVGEHVNAERIAVCTRALLDRNSAHRTIAEIAFAAGFRDISHFNRLFKRHNGLAPREFRRTALS